jgi:hypothetical protein
MLLTLNETIMLKKKFKEIKLIQIKVIIENLLKIKIIKENSEKSNLEPFNVINHKFILQNIFSFFILSLHLF